MPNPITSLRRRLGGRAESPELRPLPADCEVGRALTAAAGPAVVGVTSGGPRSGTLTAAAPTRKKASGPTRRTFLRNSWLVATLGGLGAFGGATLAFLWPDLSGGFGAEVDIDDQETILASIRENREPYRYRAGRLYLVEYDKAQDSKEQYLEVTDEGNAKVMALYQKCVHLGCTVPFCATAQWFQCPCHGSNYNRWGEWQVGPAPRGLDRFPVRIQDGRVLVNTAMVVTGPPQNNPSLNQPKEGPDCI